MCFHLKLNSRELLIKSTYFSFGAMYGYEKKNWHFCKDHALHPLHKEMRQEVNGGVFGDLQFFFYFPAKWWEGFCFFKLVVRFPFGITPFYQ